MIIAKKIDTKKLVIYLVVLLVVALVTLFVIWGESVNFSFLPSRVSNFFKDDSLKNNQALESLKPLRTTVLESSKFQSLNNVQVEAINPAVGQKNPFNETEKK